MEWFREWLMKEGKTKTAKGIVSYAREFSDCLFKRDFNKLLMLSEGKKPHVSKALSNLSKFLGVYDVFCRLVKSYGLKWRGRSSDDLIIERLTKVSNSNEAFEWIRQAKAATPELTDFMDSVSITGLRFVEATESYNLVIKLAKEEKLSNYYNCEREILKHFRFKEVFIRRTKKAFIGFIPKTLVEVISGNKPLTVNSIQSKLRKRKLRLRFSNVREANGTFLTKCLRQPEIDFLHGRVSTNVFMRNYFNPALIGDLKNRTFKAISEIQSICKKNGIRNNMMKR